MREETAGVAPRTTLYLKSTNKKKHPNTSLQRKWKYKELHVYSGTSGGVTADDERSFVDVLLICDVLNNFIRSHQLLRFRVGNLKTCGQRKRGAFIY